MKIKVYVNFCDREVLNEEAYNERKAKIASERFHEDDVFDDFMNDLDNYRMMQNAIYNDDFKLLKKLRDEFQKHCDTWADEDLSEYFEEFEIEV